MNDKIISSHDFTDKKGKKTRQAFKDKTDAAISTRNADVNGKIDIEKLGLKKKEI